MRIKATGRITGNMGDGRTVTVDWDPPSPPRDWYFYAYRITLVEADPENEMALKLIQFAFEAPPRTTTGGSIAALPAVASPTIVGV